MALREQFRDLGRSFVVIDASQARRVVGLGPSGYEAVSWVEARYLLTKLARSEPRLFARIVQTATHTTSGAAGELTQADIEATVNRLLAAMGGSGRAPSDLSEPRALYLLRRTQALAAAEDALSPDARRVRLALARVGTSELSHRGRGYRFVGSADVNRGALAQRDAYEVLNQQVLMAVLRELVQEGALERDRNTAFQELLDATEAQISVRGHCDALLLRRYQTHIHVQEQDSAPVTPSQLRKQLHWVEVLALDEDGQPLDNIRVEFELADGTTSQRTTSDDGAARISGIAPGSVTMRLVDLDGRMWRAPGAGPSGRETSPISHQVKRGECLSKIAHRYGLPGWRDVWDAPENTALRKKRKSPNILYPGDKVILPGKQINQIVRAADASHTVTILAGATVDLVLRLRGDDRQALANEAFELDYTTHGKKTTTPGSLDADGSLTATLPVQAHDVVLRLPALGFACSLTLGGLDPVRNEDDQGVLKSGVKGRLYALGYLSAAEVSDDELKLALSDYQRNEMNKTDATGELDGETLDSLVDIYGA